MDYLPRDATIEQTCDWLQAQTGQTWVLSRLMERKLTPYFWVDYQSGQPIIFGDSIQGYQTKMVFAGDLRRLEADGTALVTMFTAEDGVTIISANPGYLVPLTTLRFKREDVERLAARINAITQAQSAAQAPTPAQTAATPSPAQLESASKTIEEIQAAPVVNESTSILQATHRKKAALIKEMRHEWKSIEADLQEASRNGLKDAAHTGKYGVWDKEKARQWAELNGKIEQHSIWNVGTTVHKTKR